MEALLKFVLCFGLLQQPAPDLQWRTDYDVARREAEEQNGIICIFIGAKWCSACPAAKRTASAVLKRHPEVVAVYMDYDQNTAWCRNMMVNNLVPYVITYDWDAQKRGLLFGQFKPEQLEALLERKK